MQADGSMFLFDVLQIIAEHLFECIEELALEFAVSLGALVGDFDPVLVLLACVLLVVLIHSL